MMSINNIHTMYEYIIYDLGHTVCLGLGSLVVCWISNLMGLVHNIKIHLIIKG